MGILDPDNPRKDVEDSALAETEPLRMASLAVAQEEFGLARVGFESNIAGEADAVESCAYGSGFVEVLLRGGRMDFRRPLLQCVADCPCGVAEGGPAVGCVVCHSTARRFGFGVPPSCCFVCLALVFG